MELGCCDKLKGLIAAAKECGWFWPFEKTCIVTAKPCWISLDQQGRLHSEDRKAIEYPDGFGLYRWHGIEVPEDVILHPETITVEKIETEKNVEVRRIMLTRYGESRYIQDSGAVVVQEDQFGQLFRKEISGDEALVMVRVLNATPEQDGTVKPYWIRVRPDCTTAHGAVASTFGLTTEQYVPEQET